MFHISQTTFIQQNIKNERKTKLGRNFVSRVRIFSEFTNVRVEYTTDESGKNVSKFYVIRLVDCNILGISHLFTFIFCIARLLMLSSSLILHSSHTSIRCDRQKRNRKLSEKIIQKQKRNVWELCFVDIDFLLSFHSISSTCWVITTNYEADWSSLPKGSDAAKMRWSWTGKFMKINFPKRISNYDIKCSLEIFDS